MVADAYVHARGSGPHRTFVQCGEALHSLQRSAERVADILGEVKTRRKPISLTNARLGLRVAMRDALADDDHAGFLQQWGRDEAAMDRLPDEAFDFPSGHPPPPRPKYALQLVDSEALDEEAARSIAAAAFRAHYAMQTFKMAALGRRPAHRPADRATARTLRLLAEIYRDLTGERRPRAARDREHGALIHGEFGQFARQFFIEVKKAHPGTQIPTLRAIERWAQAQH
jgi:hypothetical protein